MSKFRSTLLATLMLVVFSSAPVVAREGGVGVKKQVAKKSHVVAAKQRAVVAKPKSKYTKRRAIAAAAAPDSLMRERLVKKVVFVHGKRKVVYQRVAYASVVPELPSAGDLVGLNRTRDPLALNSNVALVLDQASSEVLFEKNSNVALPIASITKLMTGLVVMDAKQDMDEVLTVTEEDIDKEKGTSSRLQIGSRMTRANMLHIALMSSENRAASALGRHFPGGLPAFVAAMNAKAKALGMMDTHYVDSSGLSSQNVASARDLAKLVIAAHQYPLMREYSTDTKYVVDTGLKSLHYSTTNHLVSSPGWEIGLQKTGYISEAGRCLVMQARIEGRPVVMVFLDSKGKQSRLADAGRIRKWLESFRAPQS